MSEFDNMYKDFFGLKNLKEQSDKTAKEIEDLTAAQAELNKQLAKTAELEKSMKTEADLINKISDYKGGVLYKLIDPATAGNVKADIQAFLNKKGMHVINTRFKDDEGKGFFYIRLGEDPAKESQRVQGFISQLPEVEKFAFTTKPIQKRVTPKNTNNE